MNTRQTECPDRNLAMELVRVTEAAALASGRWVGRGMKNEGDGAAVDAMRKLINSVNMRGVVVIGEGERLGTRHVDLVAGQRIDDLRVKTGKRQHLADLD